MPVFVDDVLQVLRGLEPGQVMTYGEVALEAGHSGAARAVGNLLRQLPEDAGLPWWRVVSARGRVCPFQVAQATERLAAEGVDVVDGVVQAMAPQRGVVSAGRATAP